MPNASQFLKGFNITKGMQISGYTLTNISIGHEEVERYKEYVYPIKLTFTSDRDDGKPSPQTLLRQLKSKVSGTRVIHSSYGNPYECYFGDLRIQSSSGNTIVIASEGDAIRIYD